MSKEKKKVDLSNDKAIQKAFGKVISKGSELISVKKNLKTLTVSPCLDIALNGGLLEGSWVVVSGDPKTGKEQPVSSIVYTPSGPKLMGDINVGDMVCTPDGKTATVKTVHLNGEKDIYRVHFNDGIYAECGLDHLWKVGINYHGRSDSEMVLSLREILDAGLFYSDRPRFKIQLTKEVQFYTQDIPIDPYILGAILGDGGISAGSAIFTNIDEEILTKFQQECNNRVGLTSHDKFIPDIYKYNSVDVRYSVINGLMDTDGYNDSGIAAEYVTVSEKMAYDFVEIIQSLGYTGKIKYRTTKCNGKIFPSYRIHISGNDISKLFSITRKKIDHKRMKGDLFRTIRKVEVVRSEECRCIELDNNDHLYLTNNFVVTHNSTTCLQICKNAQDEGRPVIYIDGESRLKAYNLSGTHGLDLDKIQIIHSPEDSESLSAEDFLDIAESLFKRPENNGAVCVIDSCSSLVPRSELEESSSATIRATLPKLLAHWVKKNAQNVVKNKIIVVIITHYITNTSGYGKVKVPDCGTMVQYQADTRLDINKIEPWEENSKKVGQLVHWKVGCSSLGSSGTDCISYIKYNKGIDKEKEIIELAESFGIIEKGGAWYSIPFLDKSHGFEESPKFQGQAKIYDFLVERKDIFDLIEKQVKEML